MRDHLRLVILLPAVLGSVLAFGPTALLTQALAMMLVVNGVWVVLRARRSQ